MSGGDEVGRGCPAPGAGAGLGDGPPTGANLTHWLHGCSSPKFVSGNAPNESRMKNASLSRFALGSFFVFVFFFVASLPLLPYRISFWDGKTPHAQGKRGEM